MNRRAYRVAIQLDRARDHDAEFDDPLEVVTDEQRFALVGADARGADACATAIWDELRSAIDAILVKHGVERTS